MQKKTRRWLMFQVPFRKLASGSLALLRKMACKDEPSPIGKEGNPNRLIFTPDFPN